MNISLSAFAPDNLLISILRLNLVLIPAICSACGMLQSVGQIVQPTFLPSKYSPELLRNNVDYV